MKITHNHFTSEQEALAEINAVGYHSIVVDVPAGEAETHWHDFDSMTFILGGELELINEETGEVCKCAKGTRVVAPANLLHSEKTKGFRAVIGFNTDPEKLSQPINKPPVAA